MFITIILLTLLHVCCGNTYIEPVEVGTSGNQVQRSNDINVTLYRTVKKYYCGANVTDDSYLLIYGTKGWSFPTQDVNVTLSYPTSAPRHTLSESLKDFIIIGFRVYLYSDGTHSTGYISEGGIFNDTITLTFIFSDVSKLTYQFWLYGVPKSSFTEITTHNNYIMC